MASFILSQGVKFSADPKVVVVTHMLSKGSGKADTESSQ
jgi:hypothetical protein